MTSRSRLLPFRQLLGLTLALCALMLVTAAGADEPAGPTTDGEGKAAASHTVVNGVTITWNQQESRFQAPNAEQAAKLGEAFQEAIAAKLTKERGLFAAPEKAIEIVTLPDGIEGARLPLTLLSTSIVRTTPDGHFAGSCIDSPAEYHEALAAPTSVPATWEVK